MFFDWLTIEQDFGFQLPILSDVAYQRIHLESGKRQPESPTFRQRIFCDVVSISIRGSLLKSLEILPGGGADNLFGLPTLDSCVSVFNTILAEIGLPQFTKCKRLMPGQAKENEKAPLVADGAILKKYISPRTGRQVRGMKMTIFQVYLRNPTGTAFHGYTQWKIR
ncbi:hypothetical protein QWI30_11060 [Citrobacter freundii]|nr:hypothetical protein [Citrobacter freundii]